MADVTNWAGNVTFAAQRFHRPATVEQLQELVAASDHLRVLGTGHSFNRIADTTGDLVSVAGLPPVLEIGADSVRVSAGTRYGELMDPLHAAGLALHNTGSLPHISVAGACSTGTHGSGDGLGILATAVSAIELVGADGTLRTVRRGEPGFPGSVVALGALGVVTALTLDVQPTFDIRQTVYEGLPLDAAGDALAAAYSVSLFTYWEGAGFEQVWVKQRADSDPVPEKWLGTTPADGPRHMVRGVDPAHATRQGGVAVPWFGGLPHFRLAFTPSNGDELQSEYLVPRGTVVEALHALDDIRDRISSVLLVSEVRSIAADDLWLSAAQGRDSAALHFTWIADAARVAPVVAEVERVLEPFAARPHWGKVFSTDPGRVRELWPHLPEAAAYLRQNDPTGTFRNELLDRYL
ncbi:MULTISPECIES: D-arabinono-1,4-lactone oxidase [unclassified Pseudonocardia]|uniref:D-arabinono-1,4-lactone oxidase n=1 Tax=unclassified Pseudonocardia TaxID=2619320 RepID=UPI00096804F7|nr:MULTISPECIES: D-arabinono-1,4-lactone oxidase [unclassified Pseudonocardia]MBN9099125.1 FAD-binding protein [Pseudonocardia sp.]OJY46857.1 MAG: FAD-binding protein [Pseudonocardia sp. 73-21]